MMLKRSLLWVALVWLMLLASACGGGGDTQPVPDPQVPTQILLPSGGGAIFPAGAFAAPTEVKVDDEISGAQTSAAGFPANSGVLLGSTTVEVPAGVGLATNIEIRIALNPMQATNLSFTVYSFNAGTMMWETASAASSLKGTAATADVTGGSYVSFMAATAGKIGLNATYGVFENLMTVIPGGEVPDPNQIPSVTLVADVTSVDPGDTVTLTATGSDPDGDDLDFDWMAAGGTLGTPSTSGGTSTVTWSASAGGNYTVSVSVNDGNGGVDTAAIGVVVAIPGLPPPENDAPVFDGDISADVSAPVATQMVILHAVATDADGDEITYAWTGDGGFTNAHFDEDHGYAAVEWSADAAGDYTVTCTADDGQGGTSTVSAVASVSTDLTVAVLPAEFMVVGQAACSGCHADTGTEWAGTNHSDAIERSLGPENAHGYRNESCYNCHGAGRFPVGDGGFISMDVTPEFANIQCEACHGGGVPAGMGSGHKPSPFNPGIGYARDTEGNYVIEDGVYQYDEEYDGANGYGCGLCHEGSRHGSFEEWEESGHANFVLTEEDDGNPGTFLPDHYLTSGSCNPCHSGMQFAVIHNGDDPLDLSGLTIDDPLEEHLIGCATCHDPHSNEYEAQLRMDSEGQVAIPFSDTDGVPTMIMGGKGNICIECHNGRRDRGDYDSSIWEGSGHFGPHGNPQGPVLFGIMGADLGNPPVPTVYESDHPHESWNENSCTTCHMYRRDYISSDEPALWGHNFEPRFERCVTCHSNFAGDEAGFWLWVEDYEAEIDVLLEAFRDAWPAAWKDGEGEPVNRDADPPDGSGPPREDAVGAVYRAALWNYVLVLNDASHGIHNPTFTISLLEDATVAVEALPAP